MWNPADWGIMVQKSKNGKYENQGSKSSNTKLTINLKDTVQKGFLAY